MSLNPARGRCVQFFDSFPDSLVTLGRSNNKNYANSVKSDVKTQTFNQLTKFKTHLHVPQVLPHPVITQDALSNSCPAGGSDMGATVEPKDKDELNSIKDISLEIVPLPSL